MLYPKVWFACVVLVLLPGLVLLLLAITPCPNVKDACGFIPGTTSVITDGLGHSEEFVVTSAIARTCAESR